MDTKIISLDIETLNLSMADEGLDFNNPAGWAISCVGLYDAHKDEKYMYVSNPNSMSCDFALYSLEELRRHLEEFFDDGYSLLTHNGTNFDIPILSKLIADGGGSCDSLWDKITHYDLSNSLLQLTGKRYKLQHLVKGMLGEDKSKLMDAKFAPVEWDNGNYKSVMDYCISDCILTYEVFTECAKQGEIRANGNYGEYPIVSFDAIINLY